MVLPELSVRPAWAGCTVSRVAGRNIVRFPSNTLDSTGTGENTLGLLQSAVSGSTLASETLVSGPAAPCSRPTLASASQGRPSLASGGWNLASQAGCPAAVGLAPLSHCLKC